MKTSAIVCLVLSMAGLFLLPGCATPAPASKFPYSTAATNNRVKFRSSEPVAAGARYEWSGGADAGGFATGRGTRSYYDESGAKTVEYDANFADGTDAEGPYEVRTYSGSTLTSRQTGHSDADGMDHGQIEWVYYNVTGDRGLVRDYANYRNGTKSGRTEKFYKDGSRAVFDYVNGKLDDTYSVSASGAIRRDVFFDRQKQLAQGVADHRAQTAAEEEARRSSNNQAMLGALASGLSGLASEVSADSSGSSSGYASRSDSSSGSSSGSLTLKASGTAVSDTFQDARGNSHQSSVRWGPSEESKSPAQGKAEADRKARDLVRRYNADYAKQDQEKAEERRIAAERAEKENRYRAENPVPKYKGTIPR